MKEKSGVSFGERTSRMRKMSYSVLVLLFSSYLNAAPKLVFVAKPGFRSSICPSLPPCLSHLTLQRGSD